MNKQYVKEQIANAIAEIRAEYDEKIGNIYQCPDCGAAAFRDSEHICLRGQSPPEIKYVAKPRMKIKDQILSVVPKGVPDGDIFPGDAPCTMKGITATLISVGFSGSPKSIAAMLSDLSRNKLINRKAATLRTVATNENKQFEKDVSGYVYWAR